MQCNMYVYIASRVAEVYYLLRVGSLVEIFQGVGVGVGGGGARYR